MSSRDPGEYFRNMSYAIVAGQSGCMTVMIVFGALLGGLWLDATLDTHPAFTLGLTLISVPVSLMVMVYTVLSMTARITPPKPRRKDYDDDV
ncbi:MAG: AtpZ/AtpI family protein [Anaerolineales bacterium]